MVILKTTPISFVVLVFIAYLTGVDDLFNEGACNWSCAVENANATGETLRKAMAEGRLLKLTVMYEERVKSERCANETKQDTVITNKTLKVLLKPSIDHQANRTKGSMAFITQSILEVIFSGKIFTGSYIEMKATCSFEQTSVKNSSTHFSYQRLAPFHSSQSILYYIENLASYAKTNSTLVLVRVDQQTRVSLVTTGTAGNLSSHTSDQDNELLTFSDDWLAILIIIWIIFAFYSPLIFLLFRPSKLKVKQLPEVHIPLPPMPVQEAEYSGGYFEPRRHESQPSPTENELVEENDENAQLSPEGRICTRYEGATTDAEAVPQNILNGEETRSNVSGTERARVLRVSATTSVHSDLGNTDDHGSHDGTSADQCLIPINSGIDEKNSRPDESCLGVDESREQNPPRQPVQPSPANESPEASYTHLIIVGDTNPSGVGSFIGNIFFSSLYLSSGLGLKFALKTIRSIIIFIMPFSSILLWDLLLVILPSFPKQIFVNQLPSPFLLDSLYHSIFKYPTPLVVSSGMCYSIRLFSVCYSSSEYSEQTRIPWSLYSNHIKRVVYSGMQLLLSKLSQIICRNCQYPLRQGLLESNSQPVEVTTHRKLEVTTCLKRYWLCTLFSKCGQLCIRVRNFFSPERDEENVNGKCSEHFDVPQNVSLTLEKQASITADYWNSFLELCTGYNKTNVSSWFIKMIFSPFAIIPFVLEIIWSSPLVYLCHENQWFLREQFKNKFKGSHYICSFFDIVFCGFSLVWLILIWGFGCAVPLGVFLIGTIKELGSNTNKMLPEVIIIICSVHYLWSCYGAFTKFYYDLANKLASSYQKKYDEKNQSERDDLIYYRLGDEENPVKAIPEELFENALKERKLLFRNKVAHLLVKLFFTFLLLSFVWPIISSEAVMAQSSPVEVLVLTISFFSVAYRFINDRINGEKIDISTEDVDKIVDDYIKERIRSKRSRDQ